MELKLESSLPHQLAPVNGVAAVVEASLYQAPEKAHQNPVLPTSLSRQALERVQRETGIYDKATKNRINRYSLPEKTRELPLHSILDIKMETGTGKTYVYTRTMLELHKRCGFNKFIIAVPTLPIKAGTAAFLSDAEVMRHFSDVCGYHATVELCLLEAQKQKKKGRLNIPNVIGQFFAGTHHAKNKVYALLLNTQLLTTGKLLTRDDFDQLSQFRNLAEVIADTRPVLIIDEPHRMERSSKSFLSLVECFRPQLVLRYGATFPEMTFGRGKQKTVKKDYQDLIYELSAAQSFNQGLIKGVAKEHLELPGGRAANKKVKVTALESAAYVRLRLTTAAGGDTTYTLHAGDSLAQVDADMEGVSIVSIGRNSISLSNGQEKRIGEEFSADQYSASYQESMMALALKRHFDTERENFCRSGLPIKTLALFFIDNIESYRGTEGRNDGWLRQKFLSLLEAKVKDELQKSNPPAYAAYLQATLSHLDDTCAGYFAQDNNDSDENIAKEVKAILHGKKELLSFKKGKNEPNVLRFLFSKWTLKEGWDNPNVFTICKLRSSGSETSKLQEVGRGLRLPVDSDGNRIANESFMLNYIVDFTEKDFANKLVAEINGEMDADKAKPLEISQEYIAGVAKKRGQTTFAVLNDLVSKGYWDANSLSLVPDKYDDLLREYPEFMEVCGGVHPNRIINRNSPRKATVTVRKARFEELRDLWAQLNRKYVLYFDREIAGKLEEALPDVLKEQHVFAAQTVASAREVLDFKSGGASIEADNHVTLLMRGNHFPYNDFLARASHRTNIPLHTLHKAICQVAKSGGTLTDDMFCEDSLARLACAVDDWKCRQLVGCVKYKQAHYCTKETRLTHADGSARDEVVQTYIGCKMAPGTPPAKYLYDAYAHDSALELENIQTDIDEVVVYGKIPSHSICIPTVASSNYSPDFMYLVKKTDGTKELNIVIETKAYDNETHISPDESTKINCAEELFRTMTDAGYKVHFRKQINSNSVKSIITDLLEG